MQSLKNNNDKINWGFEASIHAAICYFIFFLAHLSYAQDEL